MNKYMEMINAIAEYLEVDQAEVIDNNDNKTFSVFDRVYEVFELTEGLTEYKYAIIPVN